MGSMGLVQNTVMQSPREFCAEVVDGSGFRSVRTGDRLDDKVVRPMPRRVQSFHFCAGEPIKPFLHCRSMAPSTTLDCEPNLELLEILSSKNLSLNPASLGCSTPFFSGSPPSRSGNPMVRDVEFIQHNTTSPPHPNMFPSTCVQDVDCTNRPQESLSRATCQPKQIVGSPTYRASPRVRVEGFDCPSHGYDRSGRDTRRPVAAVA